MTEIDVYFQTMRELVEKYVSKDNLKDWNMTQKELWMSLVVDDKVEVDDAPAFFAFGKFFADYVDEHGGQAPEYQDVLVQFNPRYYT